MSDKIEPFIMLDSDAREAAEFWCSVFPGARITGTAELPQGARIVRFELFGRGYSVFSPGDLGGPPVQFTETMSLYVDCEGQEEVDRYWEALQAGGGAPIMCGWLKDRYGMRWQVIPRRLTELIADPDREKAARAIAAMQQMIKIDVAGIEAAADAG